MLDRCAFGQMPMFIRTPHFVRLDRCDYPSQAPRSCASPSPAFLIGHFLDATNRVRQIDERPLLSVPMRATYFGQPSSTRINTLPDAKNPASHNSNWAPGTTHSLRISGAITTHCTTTESPFLIVTGAAVHIPTVLRPSTPSIRIGTRLWHRSSNTNQFRRSKPCSRKWKISSAVNCGVGIMKFGTPSTSTTVNCWTFARTDRPSRRSSR